MDTNGVWSDPDGNGKFNNVTGDFNPEIWLGHARSALAYVDDDWQGFNDCALDEQFPLAVITTYTNPDTTDADLYKAEVNSLRSWVHLCAHSSTFHHSLSIPSENKTESISNSYFRDINPPNAHFYNLFCCGPGRYTSANYLAGWYIFDKRGGGINNGLTAIASAKTGSMLFFEDFYKPLGQGRDIGTAFVRWWQARGPTNTLTEKRWHYGMVLLGDPTLTWWKGAVPTLEQPENGSVFDHWPRKLELRWDPVNLPGVKYHVQLLNLVGLMALMADGCNLGQPLPTPAQVQEAYTSVFFRDNKHMRACVDEIRKTNKQFAEARAAGGTDSLGDIPVLVLSASPFPVPVGCWSCFAGAVERGNAQQSENLNELAALSSRGRLVVAEESGHYVHVDKPGVVLDAIKDVLEETRK